MAIQEIKDLIKANKFWYCNRNKWNTNCLNNTERKCTGRKAYERNIEDIPRVIPKNSLLIFEAGANTKKNKEKMRILAYHYLTLKAKKVKTYKKYVSYFKDNFENVELFEINW